MNFRQNLLFTTVVLLLTPTRSSNQLVGSEVDLSDPALSVCECAYQVNTNPCRENYQDWLIIRDGFLQSFSEREAKFKVKEALEANCYGVHHEVSLCAVVTLQNVVLLGSGNSTFMGRILENKEKLVLCPSCIHSELKSLIIKSVKEVVISPEAITERKSPLYFELKHIGGDVVFPIGFYDYHYKFFDDTDAHESNETRQSERVIFTIALNDVNNVVFKSNSITTDGVKLFISVASSLVIDTSAVVDLYSELSGISLKYINSVDILSSWGNYLFIDLCGKVILHPKSISESIFHLSFSNTDTLITRDHSLNPKNISLLSITDIKLWRPWNYSMVSEDLDILRSDIYRIPTKKSVDRTSTINLMTIRNVTVIPNGEFSIRLLCNSLYIENTIFHTQSEENNDTHSDRPIYFDTSEPVNISDDRNISGETKRISATTYRLENKNLESAEIVFVTGTVSVEAEIPAWVHICQLNDSITCEAKFSNHSCPLGFPYYFDNKDFRSLSCGITLPSEPWSHDHFNLLIFSLAGILLVVLCTLILCFLVRWRLLKQEEWQPNQLDMWHLSTSQAPRFFSHPQVVHVPPTDSSVSFRLPERFAGKTSPVRNETLSAVNLHFEKDTNTNNESIIKKSNKDDESSNVKLLGVKSYDEDGESVEQSYTTKLCLSYSSDSTYSDTNIDDDIRDDKNVK